MAKAGYLFAAQRCTDGELSDSLVWQKIGAAEVRMGPFRRISRDFLGGHREQVT